MEEVLWEDIPKVVNLHFLLSSNSKLTDAIAQATQMCSESEELLEDHIQTTSDRTQRVEKVVSDYEALAQQVKISQREADELYLEKKSNSKSHERQLEFVEQQAASVSKHQELVATKQRNVEADLRYARSLSTADVPNHLRQQVQSLEAQAASLRELSGLDLSMGPNQKVIASLSQNGAEPAATPKSTKQGRALTQRQLMISPSGALDAANVKTSLSLLTELATLREHYAIDWLEESRELTLLPVADSHVLVLLLVPVCYPRQAPTLHHCRGLSQAQEAKLRQFEQELSTITEWIKHVTNELRTQVDQNS